jgi:hypothetical protein
MNVLKLLIFFLCFCLVSCASSEDLKPIAEAGNASKGGDAESSTGQRRVDSNLKAGVTTTGDNQIDDHGTTVEAQRNTSATGSGSTYSAVTIAAGGGADALQKRIDSDPIVDLLTVQIAAESAKTEPDQGRIDALAARLEARLTRIEESAARSQQAIHVSGVNQTVTAPSNVTSTPSPLNEADAKAAGEIATVIDSAKGKEPESKPSPPEDQ